MLLCVVLGGSAQAVWGNLALQLIGIALLAYSALYRLGGMGESRVLPALAIASFLIVVIQIVPLPASVWTALPGRSAIANGFSDLGIPYPSQPISETPYATVMAIFATIPAVAVFAATLKLRVEPRWIGLAIIAAAILSTLFGALQVAGGRDSWARLYRITSPGAVGFFANQNHMATLLLVSIPMVVALLFPAEVGGRTTVSRYAMAAVLLGLMTFGIVLNGSFAAYGLVIPVVLASLSLHPAAISWRRLALPVSALTLVAGLAFVSARPIESASLEVSASGSVNSRTEIWHKTGKAIASTFPTGTGLGSFEKIYRQFEDPDQVTRTYVNHAHNDYIEFVLELGLAGILILVVFVGWWAFAALAIWTSPISTPVARAATIVSATILAHSVVDFPLRTSSISGIFAAAIAIMARRPGADLERKKGETRPTRHLKIS